MTLIKSLFFLASRSGTEKNTEERNSNKATKLIILISTVYFLGNFLDSLLTFLQIFGISIYNDLPMVVFLNGILLFASHGVLIFPYYFCNRRYRAAFKYTFLPKKYHLNSVAPTSTTNSGSARRSTAVSSKLRY